MIVLLVVVVLIAPVRKILVVVAVQKALDMLVVLVLALLHPERHTIAV